MPVEVREWIGPALASPDLVLDAQPPAEPHSGVVVDRSVRLIIHLGGAGGYRQSIFVGIGRRSRQFGLRRGLHWTKAGMLFDSSATAATPATTAAKFSL